MIGHLTGGWFREGWFPCVVSVIGKVHVNPCRKWKRWRVIVASWPWQRADRYFMYIFKPAASRSHSLRFVRSALDSIANGCYNHNQYMINNNSSSRTSLMFSLINCIRFFSFFNKSFMWHISVNILKLGFTYHACTDQSTVISFSSIGYSPIYLWLTR